MFELEDMKTYEDYKMTDTSDKIVLERKGTVGYICPNCRHMTEIDLDWNINMLTKRNTGKVLHFGLAFVFNVFIVINVGLLMILV